MNPDGEWDPNLAMGLNAGRPDRILSDATVAAMEVSAPKIQGPSYENRGNNATEPTQPRVFSPQAASGNELQDGWGLLNHTNGARRRDMNNRSI